MLTYGFLSAGESHIKDFNYSTKLELREDHPIFPPVLTIISNSRQHQRYTC